MFGEASGRLTDDIALDLGLLLKHSEKCYETLGRLECVCHVGEAQRIVQTFREDARNGEAE